MAVGSLKGLGWFVAGVVVAPVCYMVTSQVAAERQRLHQVESKIAEARKDIRGLETEFQTRASLAQIEQWNGDVLALAAPKTFASDTRLASLDADDIPDAHASSLVIPAGAPKLAPEPAVEKHGLTATAQNGVGANAGMGVAAKTATRVAMLEPRLLSASTMNDLERTAAAERQSLQ